MAKIRVLIIDDSALIRHLLTDDLSSDPDLAVCGFAANGEVGLVRIAELKPDIVVLDIDMPVMDGMQTLAAIRKTNKTLPIIMFSSLTERGAVQTMDALALGANDYVTKTPSNGAAQQHIRSQLIPKIKAFCKKPSGSTQPSTNPAVYRSTTGGGAAPYPNANVTLLAIGVSTGGPNALAELLPNLKKNFPVPILIVQHMPPMFTRLLAERLDTVAGFRVKEAKAGDLIQPGQAWVAAGGLHLEVAPSPKGIRLVTTEAAPENSCRPSVDVLFRSVAKHYGSGVLGVVLTGMGQDGLHGCENIREAHGRVLVQDEASSVVWGMPGAVFQAGLAEKALPLKDLATEINRYVGSGSAAKESTFGLSLKSIFR